eukprot:5589589-Prymnesium_polylepis.1
MPTAHFLVERPSHESARGMREPSGEPAASPLQRPLGHWDAAGCTPEHRGMPAQHSPLCSPSSRSAPTCMETMGELPTCPDKQRSVGGMETMDRGSCMPPTARRLRSCIPCRAHTGRELEAAAAISAEKSRWKRGTLCASY